MTVWSTPRPTPRELTPAAAHATTAVRERVWAGPLVTRRRLQVALAVLWLLDGALQLQPFMFTKGFADQVIAPSSVGQPASIAAAVHWSASVVASQPVVWDAFFAAVQLAIGTGLLFSRTVRIALVASVAWALGVWLFGEGLGGLAGGTATFVVGAPGAVILYAVIGIAAWPRLGPAGRHRLLARASDLQGRVVAMTSRAADDRPARWVPAAWAATWVLFAVLQALPGNDRSSALGGQLVANASSAPGWLARTERALDAALHHAGAAPVIALVVAEVAIGLLALWRGSPRRVAVVAGIAVALAVWVLGQAFGQIPTGMGTDPNSGPLVALLGLAVLGRESSSHAVAVARNLGPAPELTTDGARRAEVA